jgi:hypothetical protein
MTHFRLSDSSLDRKYTLRSSKRDREWIFSAAIAAEKIYRSACMCYCCSFFLLSFSRFIHISRSRCALNTTLVFDNAAFYGHNLNTRCIKLTVTNTSNRYVYFYVVYTLCVSYWGRHCVAALLKVKKYVSADLHAQHSLCCIALCLQHIALFCNTRAEAISNFLYLNNFWKN